MNLDKWSIFGVLNVDFKSKIKSAIVFGDDSEALVIDENDDVYGFGQNSGSCLGIDSSESTLEPRKVELLCGKNVKAFAHGSGPHVVALTENGEIYVCGQNKCGELGSDGTGTKTPILLASFTETKIVEIVSGSHHVLARDENGKVYGWGQNNNGQIEYALRTCITKPRQIVSVIGCKVIKSIACTNSASFAVSNNGKVYAWGNKEHGQLGVPSDTNITQPFKVPGLENLFIVKVACGYSHVLALSDGGNLIAWGSNNYGQLGIGCKSIGIQAPIRSASDIGRIVDVVSNAYSHRSAALTLNGNVYMWGLFKGHIITSPLLMQLELLSDVFACATPSLMSNLLPVKNKDNFSVIDSLKLAFDDPADSNLSIVVDEKPIHVHKDILKVRSEYFRSMFRGEWKEHNGGPLKIDQFSYIVYRAYLYYLYTGVVDIDQDSVLGLLELSNYHCEIQLKTKCEEIIKNTITPENAVLLYIAGVTYNTKELQDFSLKYCLNHMSAVIQSEAFSSFDLETMRLFIRKAAQAGAFRS